MSRRRMMMQAQEGKEVKEWVAIDDLTLETAQRIDKAYDTNKYTRYICSIEIPKGESAVETKNTVIFGNYALYYKEITQSANYLYVINVDTEILDANNVVISRSAVGLKNGVSIYPNETARIDAARMPFGIRTDFEFPAGTTIKVWAK